MNKVAKWVESRSGKSTHLSDSTTDDLLDAAALRQLVADTDAETAKQAVGMFIVELTERLDRLCEANAQLDRELLKKEAHAIKGSSATFGARELARRAIELERICGNDGAIDISSHVNSIRAVGIDTIGELSNRFGIDAG